MKDTNIVHEMAAKFMSHVLGNQHCLCMNVWLKAILLSFHTFLLTRFIIITIVIVNITTSTTTTAIELSLSGSSPYSSTDKTNKNKYT